MSSSEWERSYAEIKADAKLHAEYLERKRRERNARQHLKGSETARKRKWRAANRERNKLHRQAMSAVEVELRHARIVRPKTCPQCGCEGKIEAHHFLGYDPAHWLDIVWLCVTCHHAEHPRKA